MAAKARHPERWSKEVKCLEPVGGVWLNPDKMDINNDKTEEQIAQQKGQLPCKTPPGKLYNSLSATTHIRFG